MTDPDETPQPEIRGYCYRCRASRTEGNFTRYNEAEFGVVSPNGIAHIGVDYGMTLCGIDATGEKWGWRL